uniref:Uncharacterized protein n=1 Tax=Chenopodium quinoa TaxID=63459 RepID=A0A803MKQ9_CHEQI
MHIGDRNKIFYLSYEGVHEVCPLCGYKDHTLKACPKKPTPFLALIVAHLKASRLDHQGDQTPLPHSDWIHVKPQRRARPRYNNTVYSPTPNPNNPNQSPSSSNHGELANVPISNTFATLGVIHHNPKINFDVDMTFSSPSGDTTKSENSKRRKRDDGDVGSSNSAMNYD